MAEFSCSFCSACPRHGCESEEEAARCPNCSNQGAYLNFDDREVATWLREKATWVDNGGALIRAAEVLEQL